MVVMKNAAQKTPWEIASKSLFVPGVKQTKIIAAYHKPRSIYNLTTWILRYSQLKRYSKLVALEIAAYYSVDYGYAYPNYEHIAKELGISERTVGQAVQDLKLSGEWLIVAEPVKNRVRRISNRYYPLTPISKIELSLYPDVFKDKTDTFTEQSKWMPAVKHNSIADYKKFRDQVVLDHE